MQPWLAALLLVTIAVLIGCGEKNSITPNAIVSQAGDEAFKSSSSLREIPTCAGEDSLNKDQLAILSQQISQTNAAIQPVCTGLVKKSDPFVRAHIVVQYKKNVDSSVRGGEAFVEMERVAGKWESQGYGLQLQDTAEQQQADQRVARETEVAFSAKATAGRRAYEESATATVEHKTAVAKEVEEQAVSQVRIAGAIPLSLERAESYPTFTSKISVINSLRGNVEFDMKVHIRFSNAQEQIYSTSMRLVTHWQLNADPGEHVLNATFYRADEETGPPPGSTEAQVIDYKLLFPNGRETAWLTP